MPSATYADFVVWHRRSPVFRRDILPACSRWNWDILGTRLVIQENGEKMCN